MHHGFGAAAPKGFDDFDAVRSELLFPVFANVVQEDVSEDEVRYTLCFEMRDGLRHSCLIILHIAFGREIDRMPMLAACACKRGKGIPCMVERRVS